MNIEKKNTLTQTLFDLPTIPKHRTDTIKKTHHQIQVVPKHNNKLGYNITLPKNWVTDIDINEGSDKFPQWKLIGLFAPEVDPNAPFVSVSATSLPFEINLADWVDFFCRSDSFQIFSSKWWYSPTKDLVLDVGAFKFQVESTVIMRAMAFIQQNTLFMICGVSRASLWDQFKNHFLIACSTFELSSDIEQPIQDYPVWNGGNPSINFFAPMNWTIREQEDQPENQTICEVQLIVGEDMLAYLLVKAIPNKNVTLSYLLSQAMEELDLSGFEVFGSPIFIPGKDFKGSFTFHGWVKGESYVDPFANAIDGYFGTGIIPGKVGDRVVEARLGFRYFEKCAVSIYLISVTASSDILLWMRSKKAFETIRESLSTQIIDNSNTSNNSNNSNINIDNLEKPKENKSRRSKTFVDKSSVSNQPKDSKRKQSLHEILKNKQGLKKKIIKSSVDIGSQIELGVESGLGWKLKIENVLISSNDSRILNTQLFEKAEWMENNLTQNCMNCRAPFTVRKRRHHCRNCGLIFCSTCCSKKMPIYKYGIETPCRVCDNCANLLGNENTYQAIISQKKKKKHKKSYKWINCKEGSFISTKTWRSDQEQKTRFITYTLYSVTKKTYSLKIEKRKKERGMVQDTKIVSLSTEEKNNMFGKLTGEKIQLGGQIMNIEGRWYSCNVWKTIANENNTIERSQWIAEEIKFPIKTVARDETNSSYSERVAVKLREEIYVGNRPLLCIKYEGYTLDENGKKTIHIVWMSDSIPGGVVRVISKSEKDITLTTEIVDFNIETIEKIKKKK